MSSRHVQPPTPEEFLVSYHPVVQAAARKLRALVIQTVPEALEAVRVGWVLIGYRIPMGKKAPYFGYVAPLEDRAVLGFEFGYLLDDPEGLLTGKGSQVRHVMVRDESEIRPEPTAALIRAAARLAMLTKEERALIQADRVNR
ncbi:MAG: DUF1801 domain-containing protein [Anaerolineae bacterium]|nr:DUF1801 domain-containing protein [Anaerolineae bacterium]